MANSEYRIRGSSVLLRIRYSLFAIRHSSYVPLGTGIVALGVYLLTLRREVGLGDEAELALQAYQLGVTHPPGYPVHTFLGKLLNLAVTEPALATNLLSALCTSIAVGFLSAIVLGLTRAPAGPAGPARTGYNTRAGCAMLAPLVFAFVPTVWRAAVTTEVYNVNICIIAAALFFAMRWRARPSTALLCMTSILLGVSLGSSLANLLLLPGFIVLSAYGVAPVSNRWKHLALGALITALTACAVLSWSYVRCSAHVPLGAEWLPNTAGGFLRFLSGSQYTIPLSQPASFYINRPFEHALHWFESLMWLGAIPGLWGLWVQWKRQRSVCVALFVMFAMNLGYFTFYPWLDYREMVTPSYFIFAVWIAYGACALDALRPKIVARIATLVVPLIVVLGLLASGLRVPLKERAGRPVTDFGMTSFEWFPAGAVVVARWYEFTPLLYFQQTRGLRPDLTIIERSDRPRHYRWGTVADWRRYA